MRINRGALLLNILRVSIFQGAMKSSAKPRFIDDTPPYLRIMRQLDKRPMQLALSGHAILLRVQPFLVLCPILKKAVLLLV